MLRPKHHPLIIPLLICIGLCGCSTIGYPSDRLLQARFRSAEADFNKLASMFKEDSHLFKLDRESAYSSWDTKADLPQQRMDEYRHLLTKLKLVSVNRGEASGDVYLLVWTSRRMLFGAKSKYYLYAETPPEPLVDSLDKLLGGTEAFAHKKISNNWYLLLHVW